MGKERQIELTEDSIRLLKPTFINCDSAIEFEVEIKFDDQKYFGVDYDPDNEDILFYVVYDAETEEITANYSVTRADKIENFDWELTDDEQELFKTAMDNYVRAEGLMSIEEYYFVETNGWGGLW